MVRIGPPSQIFSNNATILSDIWSIGKESIAIFQFTTWHTSFPDFFISLRHYTVIGKQLLLSNDRNSGRWVVLGLSQDGACTDLAQNLSENKLKGDLSNAATFNQPLFSLVNTFKSLGNLNYKILKLLFICFYPEITRFKNMPDDQQRTSTWDPCSWRNALYAATSTTGLCCGRYPSPHVPEREDAANCHNIPYDLSSRSMLWGTAIPPCFWRRGRCMLPQCTLWPLLQVYAMRTAYVPEEEGAACMQPQCTLWPLLQLDAVGYILRFMFLKERALYAAKMYIVTSTPSMFMLWGTAFGPCSWRRGALATIMQWPLLQVYAVGDSLRSMFLKERALHAATMYIVTSTPGLCCGGQPSVHVPEGEGASCCHNVHCDLYSRSMLWGTAFGPCSWRRGRCCGKGHPPASPGLCHQGILVFSTSTIAALARCWLGCPERLKRCGPC